MKRLVLTYLALVALLFTSAANAGSLRDRIEKHMQDKGKSVSLPEHIQVTRDIAMEERGKLATKPWVKFF
jgi:hypothetical protein